MEFLKNVDLLGLGLSYGLAFTPIIGMVLLHISFFRQYQKNTSSQTSTKQNKTDGIIFTVGLVIVGFSFYAGAGMVLMVFFRTTQ